MNMLHIDTYVHIHVYDLMHNITCIQMYAFALNINIILYFVTELTLFVTELTLCLIYKMTVPCYMGNS